MKTNKIIAVQTWPYKDLLIITVERHALNSQPTLIKKHVYKFKYNYHTDLVVERFTKMIEILNKRIVKEIRGY